jgi:hypothetical protein
MPVGPVTASKSEAGIAEKNAERWRCDSFRRRTRADGDSHRQAREAGEGQSETNPEFEIRIAETPGFPEPGRLDVRRRSEARVPPETARFRASSL